MIEGVLDTMRTVLVSKMTEELGKQDGLNGGSIICEPIASILIGDETPPNTGLPAIVLGAENMGDIEHSVSGKKDANYNISIRVAVTSTDEDISQRRLWRTMRAIECALEVYLIGQNSIIDYKTVDMNFHASVFEIEDGRSTEKGGIIQAQVKERLTAYVSGQV